MNLCPECQTELDDDGLTCATPRCEGMRQRAELAAELEPPGRRRFRAEDIITSFRALKSRPPPLLAGR